MKLIATSLADVLVIEPRVFGDARGFFMESWNQGQFAAAGLDLTFVQDNHSRSARGVLRGLHFQLDRPQGKLVRVVNGAVHDVVMDLRRSSPSFGRWESFELSADNHRMLWVPPGFAHGFLTLSDDTDFLYKCTEAYLPALERTLQWNDPSLAGAWPDWDEDFILSDKDRHATLLADIETFS